MGEPTGRKPHNSGKLTRLAAILLAAIGVMLVVISVPAVRAIRKEMARIGCKDSLAGAMRDLKVEYLSMSGLNPEEAKAEVTRAMLGWDDLCPSYGDVYLVVDQDKMDAAEFPYDLVCGIHGPDAAQRTRLNANHVLEQIVDKVKRARALGNEFPETVTVELNGQELVCVLTDEESGLRWGTYATPGFSGTVAYYGIAGHSDFGSEQGVKEGEICYFSFGDPEHCANWTPKMGWEGDSWD